METYKSFRPTQFDAAGLALPDQQNWFVAPVSQTRASEALSRANFAATLEALGGESDTIEVHRFGHWGPGWFEIIIIDPADSERVKIAEDIESGLADCPIVDEELFSRLEDEDCAATWENCYDTSERVAYLRRHSYTAESFGQLYRAIKGSWHEAANILHCPSDLASC